MVKLVWSLCVWVCTEGALLLPLQGGNAAGSTGLVQDILLLHLGGSSGVKTHLVALGLPLEMVIWVCGCVVEQSLIFPGQSFLV